MGGDSELTLNITIKLVESHVHVFITQAYKFPVTNMLCMFGKPWSVIALVESRTHLSVMHV